MGLSLVLSSIGPSLRPQGHLMGEYQYDVRSKSFKQRSTNQIDESSYLYQFSQNTWIVGPVVGSSSGHLYSTYNNYNNSQIVPSAFWRFRTYSNTWQLDQTIRVEYGGLNECNLISVHLFGRVARALEGMEGTYSKTDKWKFGRPIYDNNKGSSLQIDLLNHNGYSNDKGRWTIGLLVRKRWIVLQSQDATLYPQDSTSWMFLNQQTNTWEKACYDCVYINCIDGDHSGIIY